MSEPAEADAEAALEAESRSVTRRIRWISFGAYVLFVPYVLLDSGFRGFIGLTCATALIMINFLWLGGILEAVLRPTPHLRISKVLVRTLARLALLGVAISIMIGIARFNAISVLLGCSTVAAGAVGEALYSNYKSFTG